MYHTPIQKQQPTNCPSIQTMLDTMDRNLAERPAREAALHDALREFANRYGTDAIKPILKSATGNRVHL